jgi:hypothetical protein
MTEKLEVTVARIDENVKHIVKEINCIKDDCDAKMLEHNRKFNDHENRIRDNEKFKQRGYGALGLISAVLTIVGIAIGKILLG